MHTIEYYSTMKRNKVLIHAMIQMNFEDNLLSERSQSKKIHV